MQTSVSSSASCHRALPVHRGSRTSVRAAKNDAPEAQPRKEQSEFGKALNALDFSQTRSKKDAELLYEAKYGKRGADGKMTREQYAALRRKVGGTAKDYWKDWVEEEAPKNIKPYARPSDGVAGASVPYLPFLVGVLVAMLATTVFVASKTG